MSQAKFSKLFKATQYEFNKIAGHFDTVEIRMDHFTGAVDAYAKQYQTYVQQVLAVGHKEDHLEKGINSNVAKIGLQLGHN